MDDYESGLTNVWFPALIKKMTETSKQRWARLHPDRMRAASKRYRERHPGEAAEKARAYRAKNPEASRAANKKWRERHPERMKAARTAWEQKNPGRQSARLKAEPSFKIARNLRNRLWCVLKGLDKSASTLRLLGMDLKEFRIYIQGQFRSGMTWENYGPVWHLDHVVPCAKFNLSDAEQQKICFRWDNLQPLFAEENLRKSSN
jgi:Prasinovirus endonuclease VII